MNISRSKLHPGNHSRKTYTSMHSQPVEGLACSTVSAVCRYVSHTLTFRCPGKTTHRHRKAVHKSQSFVMANTLHKVEPHMFFDLPQVGRLSCESSSMHTGEGREEVRIVSTEVGEDTLILAESEMLTYHFNGENLAIGHDGRR